MSAPPLPHLTVQGRVGVIGDIHTDHLMLRWALDALQAQGVELLLATGDLADGPYGAEGLQRCCEMLQAAQVHTVIGNHDRWMLDGEMRDLPDATFLDEVPAETRSYLRSLPPAIELTTPVGEMLFGHGLGSDDMATLYPHDHGYEIQNNAVLQKLLREGRYHIVVSGHTHMRMRRNFDDVTFLNAGALAKKRGPCCLLLDFPAREARFLDYADGNATVPGPVHTL